jgi:hypothetical protein
MEDANGEFWVQERVYVGREMEDSADRSEWRTIHVRAFETIEEARHYRDSGQNLKVIE